MKKVLIVLDGDDIAPRFDLSLELSIVCLGRDGKPTDKKDMVLARASVEALCGVATAENVDALICGGIEKEHIEYLGWKSVEVIHSVVGPAEVALSRFRKGVLKSGDILFRRRKA